uniref:Uncharacterized protein n=1 Tax=Bionectria ochroleuca TaxID=29856 RepID=A0A8H7NCK5_BIOOC
MRGNPFPAHGSVGKGSLRGNRMKDPIQNDAANVDCGANSIRRKSCLFLILFRVDCDTNRVQDLRLRKLVAIAMHERPPRDRCIRATVATSPGRCSPISLGRWFRSDSLGMDATFSSSTCFNRME